MMKFFFSAMVCLASVLAGWGAAATAQPAPAPIPLLCVDPLVGTGGHGHLYPGATVPFGMVQLSPDTRTEGWDGCSGYYYADTTIQGFTHTHLTGTGAADLGDILIMPIVGPVRFDAGQPGSGYASAFSHADEKASPGYYSVFLKTPGVLAEMTATPRCGLHRYTFPAADAAHFVIDLAHGIGNTPYDCGLTVENDTTISGYKKTHGWAADRSIFFVMQFSKPFRDCETKTADAAPTGPLAAPAKAQGATVKACVDFAAADNEVVLVKVGISGTSVEGARKNLAAEVPGFDFAAVRAAAERAWSKQLNAVQIETPDPHIRRTFYTNLYESMLAPTLYDDIDGRYMGNDHHVHAGAGFQNYTELSLWDTYRAEQPWLTLTQPKLDGDIVSGLLAQYDQNGSARTIPVWPLWGNETYCMIGYHSAPVMVDAYFKRLAGFDPEHAYRAMRDTAMQDRDGLDSYRARGYVASRPGQCATSKTLEYAYDDWCIARMAQALGHTADARLFYRRAANYRNLFDRTVGFMRGRKASGAWRAPFTAVGLVNDEYTEADAWQYAFCVQQDLPGLISLYGGDRGFVKKMDALFAASPAVRSDLGDMSGMIGQLAQGDEQSHHLAYLYDYAGAPYKTQQRVRQIMTELYNDTVSGQCGNNDCGQMSAWYLFSALGFYPVNPASGVYVIGSPLVSRATLRLDPRLYDGRTFTVIAERNSPQNVYIQSASLNGHRLDRTWITHKEIVAGGILRFVMGPRPNALWGSARGDRPPATMPAGFRPGPLPAPSSGAENRLIALALPIRVACGADADYGGFKPDPNLIDGGTNGRADAPIDVSAPHAAPAGVYRWERYASDFSYKFPVPKGRSYTVRLHFAEIFDSGAGQRVENVRINGRPALSDFDIYKAGGGMNKAVVREFQAVRPDASSCITVRVSAAPNSPDQNAKINGIEILAEPAG